jgi:hypothetical protein
MFETNKNYLPEYAATAASKLHVHVSETAMALYVGSLVNYSWERAEEDELFPQGNPYVKFDPVQYANDLIEYGLVVQLVGKDNDIRDEDSVWLVNPDDFVEIEEKTS